MNILKKVVRFLKMVILSIDQKINGQNDRRALLIDFERAKSAIAAKNKKFIIEQKLMPYAVSFFLEKDNYLITEKEARKLAEGWFLESKLNGNLDELNRLVEGK